VTCGAAFTMEELLSSGREFEEIVAAWKEVLEFKNCEMSLCPPVVESCPKRLEEVA